MGSAFRLIIERGGTPGVLFVPLVAGFVAARYLPSVTGPHLRVLLLILGLGGTITALLLERRVEARLRSGALLGEIALQLTSAAMACALGATALFLALS